MESPYNHDSLQVHCIIHVPVNHLSQVSSAKLLQFKTETATTPCPIILEGERERVEYVSLLIGTHTYLIYMHFILFSYFYYCSNNLLECTHCFVALNMHENQQHPPHLNKPYNHASMQSGPSIAFSIRCLLTWQLCNSILGNSEVLWYCIHCDSTR